MELTLSAGSVVVESRITNLESEEAAQGLVDLCSAGAVELADPKFGASTVMALPSVKVNEALAKAKALITSHEGTIASHESTIARHARTIAEHESTIASHEASLVEHETSIAEQEGLISTHEATIYRHEGTIADHEGTIAGHESTIARRERDIAEREDTILAHQTTIAQTKRTLAEHEGTLAECETTISTLGSTIAAHEGTIAARESTIADQQGTIAEHQTRHADLVGRHGDLKSAHDLRLLSGTMNRIIRHQLSAGWNKWAEAYRGARADARLSFLALSHTETMEAQRSEFEQAALSLKAAKEAEASKLAELEAAYTALESTHSSARAHHADTLDRLRAQSDVDRAESAAKVRRRGWGGVCGNRPESS